MNPVFRAFRPRISANSFTISRRRRGMDENESFSALMQELRSGQHQAANAVFCRYAGQLVALARRHLDERFANKVDPEDVVQSAYRSFFVRHRDGRLDVENWQSLWGLLTLITLRKCADRVRYFQADRRDVNREAAGGKSDDGPQPWQNAVGREPTPDEAAVLAETVERLLGGLDADERPIVELSLQGYSTEEISEQLGRASRSVRRLRERVRLQLESAQAGESV
jgi:RNA polymerase sigma factor (sigma-70 family)